MNLQENLVAPECDSSVIVVSRKNTWCLCVHIIRIVSPQYLFYYLKPKRVALIRMECLFEGWIRGWGGGLIWAFRIISALGLCILSNALMSWLLFSLPNFIVSGIPFCRSEFLRLSNSAAEFWALIFGPGILSVCWRSIFALIFYWN